MAIRLYSSAVLLMVVGVAVFFVQRGDDLIGSRRPTTVEGPVTVRTRLLKGTSSTPSDVQRPVRLSPSKPRKKGTECRNAYAEVKAKTFTPDQMKKALDHRSSIAGFHKKAGIVSSIEWRPEFKRQRNIDASYWFASSQMQRRRCKNVQPPHQFPGCTVMINHHYQFIWIKGKRVGSSIIETSLGGTCTTDASKTAKNEYCSKALDDNKEVTMKDVETYWNKYFVFAFVRNPYAKFASAYMHVSRSMGDCPKLVNFSKLCDSPFLFAKVCSTLSCCWPGAISHHFQHAVDQSSCLFTDSGDIAVDFIGQTETLKTDLKTVLKEINKRKASHLPKLKIEHGALPKLNAFNARRPLRLYMLNSTCLSRVEHYYWRDFDLLGYDRITSSVR